MRIRFVAPILFLSAAGAIAQTAGDTPATAPAIILPVTTQAATRPTAEVSPAAEPLLKQLADAYAQALPLKVEAKIAGRFDVAGRSKAYELAVRSHTSDGIRFIHTADGAGLIVSNGKRGFLYDERRKVYATLEVKNERVTPDALDEAISDILLEENAALLPALVTDAGELLERLATKIDVGPAETIDGLPHATLVLTRKEDATVTLAISPQTGLVRRAIIDYKPLLKERGAAAIQAGELVADFSITRQINEDAKAYDWQPPDDADETTLARELLQSQPGRPTRRGPTTRPVVTTLPSRR